MNISANGFKHIPSRFMAMALTLLLVLSQAATAWADDDPKPAGRKPAGRTSHRETPIRELPDSLQIGIIPSQDIANDSVADAEPIFGSELTLTAPADEAGWDDDTLGVKTFNPDPTRAVWLSVLCPGLGQAYNRRFWKLPIIVGGFMGLGYGTAWNNKMLRDYTRAYVDLVDGDPSSQSYLDFLAKGTTLDDYNTADLQRIFDSRRKMYRRNRDLCIISMVGVYLLAIVDAYVDASLSHFDITPDLSMDVAPAVIPDARSTFPGVGMQWALNF